MRRFQLGQAFAFLLIIVVAVVAARWFHGRVEGRYQGRVDQIASYTLEDWIDMLDLDTLIGEPPVTPVPANRLPFTPRPLGTPAP